MEGAQTETLYDRTIRNLKNNKIIVLMLIAFGVVLALAQLQGALSGVKNSLFPTKPRFRATVFLQQYDFMMGYLKSPETLSSVGGNGTDISQMLLKSISTEISPALGALKSSIQIDGTSLRADQKLRCAVLVFQNPMSQVARVRKEIGQADQLDLAGLFNDGNYLNRGDNSIDMEVVPQDGYFNRWLLTIFRTGNGFSFEKTSMVRSTTVQFTPHKPKILLATFDSDDALKPIATEVENSLRTELGQNPAVELCSATEGQLNNIRDTIQHMAPGQAKSAMANQNDCDFILTGNVIAQ